MKTFLTISCCGLLALYGASIALFDNNPTNTISAEPAPLHFVTKTDTTVITNTVRDTVVQVKYKTKYKVKQAPCTTCDSVSITGSSVCGNRKAISPDTLPVKLYRIRGTIEPVDESKHDSNAGKE